MSSTACLHPQSAVYSIYSSVTLNSDVLIPKSEVFISVAKCINIGSFGEICLNTFQNTVKKDRDILTEMDGHLHEQARNLMHLATLHRTKA